MKREMESDGPPLGWLMQIRGFDGQNIIRYGSIKQPFNVSFLSHASIALSSVVMSEQGIMCGDVRIGRIDVKQIANPAIRCAVAFFEG